MSTVSHSNVYSAPQVQLVAGSGSALPIGNSVAAWSKADASIGEDDPNPVLLLDDAFLRRLAIGHAGAPDLFVAELQLDRAGQLHVLRASAFALGACMDTET